VTEGDHSHRVEVKRDPYLRAIGQVDVLNADRQDAEPAAAAEVPFVHGGGTTGSLAVERRPAEGLFEDLSGLAAVRCRRWWAGDSERECPGRCSPAASVTVTVKVCVPSVAGAPSSSPEGRRVSPAGGCPDQVYGDVPPVASKLVVKKLLTNTLWPAPMSHTPLAQVKNWVVIASGGLVPEPVPVSGAVCGLPGALSVTVSAAVRVPEAVGLKVIGMSQLVPGARVRPEQPSLTTVKSSVLGTAALLMNIDASPVLATVIVCGALAVPMACEPNVNEGGVNVTAAAAAGAAIAPTATSAAAATGSNRRSRGILRTSRSSKPGLFAWTRAAPGTIPLSRYGRGQPLVQSTGPALYTRANSADGAQQARCALGGPETGCRIPSGHTGSTGNS
jgi:hypothetical protein